MNKICILILASSSAFAANVVQDLIYDPKITVATSVFTIQDAYRCMSKNNIDVLLCDGRIIGLDIKRLSQWVLTLQKPIPIVLACQPNDPKIPMYRMFVADIVKLPERDSPMANQAFIKELCFRMKIAPTSKGRTSAIAYKWRPGLPFATRYQGIIAIGASAGGTEATEEVLKNLPPNMPGIIITQHMPPIFTKVYAERLNSLCALTVREAKDNDAIEPGVALVAPGGMQMRVRKVSGRDHPIVRCSGEERVSGHCPSVDVMFDTVAQSMGTMSVGIILTGMGADGAEGLLAMQKKGCYTIGQDEQTSMVYGMPQAAFKKGAVKQQLPLGEIASALCSYLMSAK